MANQKIFILLPDGVGLRNFAFTEFYNLGKEQGFDIVFWNNTDFNLSELGFTEIKIKDAKNHPLTDVYKNARKHIELNLNIQKSGNTIYDNYRFPFSYNTIKSSVKSFASRALIWRYSNADGLLNIRKTINKLERKTDYYQQCLETLQSEKPDLVFCTSQRNLSSVAPILAAQELGIPTASFIFSWDNLPKATMVIDTDYYFVWSNHMKQELLHYYSEIWPANIFITGTPQFEPHFDENIILDRTQFFSKYNLDTARKYICYSGDDITTSPNDADYLRNVAEAVRKLNDEGFNLGIIFRKCPVDFSTRYDDVLNEYAEIISSISPKWKKFGSTWNSVIPESDDLALLANTARHSELVINLGSSMVFDFVAHGKPCGYIRYDSKYAKPQDPSVNKIYSYIHFNSMPSRECVVWLEEPQTISDSIKVLLSDKENTVIKARNWFEKIDVHPPQLASDRIWKAITYIVNQNG